MNKFTISPTLSWFTNPRNNKEERGLFLFNSINAFYHSGYQGGNNKRRETIGTVENIITTLKNQFEDKSDRVLLQAGKNLLKILMIDLPKILQETNKNNLTICVIPRAKALRNYSHKQLVFRRAVAIVAQKLEGFSDGTDYIKRHTNTITTHMYKSGHGGDGNLPYPGITKATCTISDNIKGKDIY